MTTLLAKSIFFYSQGDEGNFFQSIARVPFLINVYGEGDELYFECASSEICADDFLTLYSIFKRYGVDCRQLSLLQAHLKDGELEYVLSPEMVWHADIFS